MSLQTDIAQFTGTDQYYKHFTGLLYTDGIQFVAEKYGAYWLIDAIASYQHTIKDPGLKEFQLWKLRVENMGTRAILTCRADSDQPHVIRQDIPFTDFPESITLYVEGGVLLLLSEH